MNYKVLLLIFIILLSGCKFNKVVKHHGVHFLEKKQQEFKISETNINDIKKVLGPPSSINYFDNEVLIYIERKTSVSGVLNLGKKKIISNNVLVLEFNNRGILIKKDFYDKYSLNKLDISRKTTSVLNDKESFIRSLLRSLRHKINDPLNQKRIK